MTTILLLQINVMSKGGNLVRGIVGDDMTAEKIRDENHADCSLSSGRCFNHSKLSSFRRGLSGWGCRSSEAYSLFLQYDISESMITVDALHFLVCEFEAPGFLDHVFLQVSTEHMNLCSKCVSRCLSRAL